MRHLPVGGASGFIVSGLTAVAFALRLANLDQSLFQDEFWTYGIVVNNGPTGVVSELYDDEATPPLHFLLAWLAAQVGDPSIWIRVPSLVFGTATVPVVYLLGRRTFGNAAGLLAASLVALSPFAIFYAAEARGYATMAFLIALSTLALVHALEEGRPGWWIAYAASACGALYTHYTTIFVVVAQAVWAFWAYRDQFRPLLVAHGAIVLGYIPWLPGYLKQRDNAGVGATESIGLETIGAALDPHRVTPGKFLDLLPRVLPGHPFLELGTVPGRAGLALLVIGGSAAVVAVVVRLARNGSPRRLLRDRRAVLIVVLALATPVGLLAYGAIGPNLYTPRNMTASIPALAIVMGAVVTSSGRLLAPIAATVVLAAFAIGVVRSFDDVRHRPAFREVARFLDDAVGPGDRVVDQSLDQLLGGGREGIEAPLDVYLERVDTVYRANVNDEAAWQRAGQGGRVFLVRLQAGLFRGIPPLAGPQKRFVLRDTRVYPGLAPLAVGRYQGEVAGRLARRGGHSLIHWSLGKELEVVPRAARGLIDRISTGRELTVTGWAADARRERAVDWVLLFSGGRLLAAGLPNVPRPDVAEAYGGELLVSGYSLVVPTLSPGGRVDPARLRVFGVVRDRAYELRRSRQARDAARPAR